MHLHTVIASAADGGTSLAAEDTETQHRTQFSFRSQKVLAVFTRCSGDVIQSRPDGWGRLCFEIYDLLERSHRAASRRPRSVPRKWLLVRPRNGMVCAICVWRDIRFGFNYFLQTSALSCLLRISPRVYISTPTYMQAICTCKEFVCINCEQICEQDGFAFQLCVFSQFR